MGENARFKNGHARVETRVLKTLACRKSAGGSPKHRQTARWCVLKTRAFYLYTVECENPLRVGVRAKNASVSGFACRPF